MSNDKILELTPDEIKARAEQAKKDFYLAIFIQLNGFQRYQNFVEKNYNIEKGVDENSHQIHVRVSEKPELAQPIYISKSHIFAAHAACKRMGVKHPAPLLNLLVSVFSTPNPEEVSEPEEPRIIPATEGDMKTVIDLTKNKAFVQSQELLKKKLD